MQFRPACIQRFPWVKIEINDGTLSVDHTVTKLRTQRKKTIREAIAFLNINRKSITVLIEGGETLFASKIVKVDHGDLASSGLSGRLVIEWLSPSNGKELIQSRRLIRVRFSIGKYKFEFSSYYVAESLEPPYFGHIVTYPEALVIVEIRRNRRSAIGTEQPPLFDRAKLIIRQGGSQRESFDLQVFDVSEKGVGILVDEESFKLQDRIRIGDKVELELYAPWTMVRVDGTVRHNSRMAEGKYRNYYLLGIELDEKLEHYV
jgi:hypothetical protein